ncbi:hypothetical protein [Roseovarius sp. C03]|uniref:hypothetical protein n=1 Tax=Roseovarius sp. C03 TaxID=3449222 RepID=UPI003EDC0C9B
MTEIATPKKQSAPAMRRVLATAGRIEELVAIGQRRGLTISKICQLPDGTTEIHFGETTPARPTKAQGWDI